MSSLPPFTGTFKRNQLRDQAYTLLKSSIANTDIYDPKQEVRLDEPQLRAAVGSAGRPSEKCSRSWNKKAAADDISQQLAEEPDIRVLGDYWEIL